jgi:phospho-N-acetylmuramoyl-pentapeptide-transferase
VPGVNELAVFAARRSSAPASGFLWFNTYPRPGLHGRRRFALALGGALGMLAVLTKNELLSR